MLLRIIFGLISFLGLFIFSLSAPEVPFISLSVLFLFIVISIDFFLSLGSGIPIKQLILFIALLQWGVAPFLSYHYYTDSDFYFMQIPEETYMAYIFPAVISFFIGLFLPLRAKSNLNFKKIIDDFNKNKELMMRRGKMLFFIGLTSLIFQPFFPTVIAFALFLLSKLIFIGAFYLFAAKVKYRYLYLFLAFIPVIISAAQSSVFHDMFIWGGFLFIIYALINQIGAFKKLLFLSAAVSLFLFVQLIKKDYRGAIQDSTIDNRTEILAEVATQKLKSDVEEDYFQGLVDRLNQGWIIARIMFVVPTFEPFAEGETIREGIKSAFLPRFLMPDKIESGGYYFERFTGIPLYGTSMNLGLVGEAYANYGEEGGILFMFIFGLIINLFLTYIYYKSHRLPEIIFWIPFLFLYMIKAEDDFTTMINQFTKAVYVMIGIFWLMKKFFPKTKSVLMKN